MKNYHYLYGKLTRSNSYIRAFADSKEHAKELYTKYIPNVIQVILDLFIEENANFICTIIEYNMFVNLYIYADSETIIPYSENLSTLLKENFKLNSYWSFNKDFDIKSRKVCIVAEDYTVKYSG